MGKFQYSRGRRALTATTVVAGAALLSVSTMTATSGASGTTEHLSSGVLLVGTYKGHTGQYSSIQAAVDAAKPGQWILVAPGDYHENDDMVHPPSSATLRHGGFGGVLITTSNVHLRGMNRNTTIVDGTAPNGNGACSTKPQDQRYGPVVNGSAIGQNGIVVYEANGVSVDNLTTCNFLSGSGDSGNGVWWNGGAGTATINLHGYEGSYLSATDTFFNGEQTAGTYGIFSSDAAGPATWTNIYASNQNDSGMYVGACQQLCGITISGAWMENNALGYSGTNSGGAIVIEHSRFDNNEDGLDTNTQINGDPPAPQNGACPKNGISPITHTHSCWVVMDNIFDHNNNINTPRAGSAAAGPTGTGMTISGGTNDTVMNNTFEDNGAWGLLFVPYPDQDSPGSGQTCAGTGGHSFPGLGCVYDAKNDAMINNTFSHNGYFGNPTNSDFGELTLNGDRIANCFKGNTTPDGTFPSNLQATEGTCGVKATGGNALTVALPLYEQALCDTGFGSCPAGSTYPKPTGVVLAPLPTSQLQTMPNPCKGVPANAWCKNGSPI